ncbi:hypothetical protein GCM10007424_08740 [Flavobacterium suaedae]|uniref:Uncharacterized protein n=1 Tax=Flavobacterium suaedae TaxID=1767027 RepID=A0ABQ1JL23_9FLAO|nr:hypothetical protein [Flavobacterium suaedae]GGB70995.1 hypothetical protein GCM10007424_08740 [Flavobacterium suaedae]
MQFKKHISLLLSSLILLANMGLALNVHYCHGEISQVSLAYKVSEPCNTHHLEAESSCCAEKDATHKSCCKNDLVKLKDRADNVIIEKSLHVDLASFCAFNEYKPLLNFGEKVTVKSQIPAFYCEANAPPLYKLYCRYTLYA